MNGPSTAKGARARRRYRRVRGRAASADTLKNRDPASDTAKRASAAFVMLCTTTRRPNGPAPKSLRAIPPARDPMARDHAGSGGPLVDDGGRSAALTAVAWTAVETFVDGAI